MSVGLRIGQRLLLTVLPAVLGCLTVAGLAYWGQYGNVVPTPLLLLAVFLAIGSLGVAWWNARYVARRIERLAGPDGTVLDPRATNGVGPARLRGRAASAGAERANGAASNGATPDELDAIEATVRQLSSDAAAADAARARSEAAAAARVAEYAALLSSATAAAAAALDEVRLPIHILLENHFGDLNENQEEMLEAARAAADVADAELGRVGRIIRLDQESETPHDDSIALGELLPAVVAETKLRLRATDAEPVTVRVDIEPPVPRVRGDLSMLHDALALIVDDAVSRCARGGVVSVACRPECQDGGGSDEQVAPSRPLATRTVRIDVDFEPVGSATLGLALARRLVEVQGGTFAVADGATRVCLRAGEHAVVPTGERRANDSLLHEHARRGESTDGTRASARDARAYGDPSREDA